MRIPKQKNKVDIKKGEDLASSVQKLAETQINLEQDFIEALNELFASKSFPKKTPRFLPH